jgi:acyl carrier protein
LTLGPHQIDTSRPIQELGADSLTVFTLTGALADWLQLDIPASLLWDHDSIDAAALALAAETPATLPTGVIALQPHGKRRPLFCFPGIGGHPVTFARLAQHL